MTIDIRMEPLITTRSMPKRKRSSTSYKRRRTVKRRRKTMRRKKPLALQQHNFVERKTLDLVMQVDTEANAVGMFKAFNLDEVTNASNYKELFEFYKINKVVATFRYKSVASPAFVANAGSEFYPNEVNPLLYFKVDHNDVTADALIDMRKSSRTRTKQLSNNESEFSIVLKPAVQSEAYKSALASTYIPKWGQWLSCDDGQVPHYGLKAYAIGYRGTNFSPGNIQVEFKYYLSFKNNE